MDVLGLVVAVVVLAANLHDSTAGVVLLVGADDAVGLQVVEAPAANCPAQESMNACAAGLV
ncbi:hypothetical protein ACWDE0_16175 [Streptomyces sp. 900105755]